MHQIEPLELKQERAFLVALKRPRQNKFEVEDFLDELALLADTAGANVVGRMVQERNRIDSAFFIGKGKSEELARKVSDLGLDLVIFDDDLSPAQIRNLENVTESKIIDRSGLILDIFAKRAKTREAKTQVELAQLQYILPRLTRRWTHLSRQVGGIGTRGPGETQLEVDRRMVGKRISLLKKELEKIARQRSTRRRNRSGLFQVALVGYTNTGKSTLLNSLTKSEVETEDRLFVTLDSTVRSLRLDEKGKILMVDTVGFIRKLPHHLVASFRSTLEEAVSADMLLHVVDISHPKCEEQVDSVNQVLEYLEIRKKPTILVFNKVDMIDDETRLHRLSGKYDSAIFISATRGYMLGTLRKALKEAYLKEQEHLAAIRCQNEKDRN